MNKNDYNDLSNRYQETHKKPDKQYSTLPTLLALAGDLSNKKIIDIGCGDGYFTKEFARTAQNVIGIDNSEEQIKKAQTDKTANTTYVLADMETWTYPESDIIFAPYVLCYLESKTQLQALFKKLHNSLSKGGVLIGAVDMPNKLTHDMKKYGSIKKVEELKEGAKLTIELYNKNDLLVTLHSTYHKKDVLENFLKEAGFTDISWPKPIISTEGIKTLGEEFWAGYIDNCDLAYFKASK